MGCGLTSGLTSGKQLTLEQESLNIQIADNEAKVRDDYIKNILPVTSPIRIPSNARILVQNKDFCSQIKYQWTCDGYNYTCHWHTRTPNAPSDQGDSWVIERYLPGIGAGPDVRPAKRELLVGEDQWVSKAKWDEAIRARKQGIITEAQREILNNVCWKLKNNYDFYNGFEGEGKVILSIKNNKDLTIQIWDGYFEDIFSNPIFNNDGWQGFTRDYQEGIGAFSGDDDNIIINLQEYIDDLKQYIGKSQSYDETDDCLEFLIAFFEQARDNHDCIELRIF